MDRKATKHKMTCTGAHLAEAGANSEERVRVRHVEVWSGVVRRIAVCCGLLACAQVF
jgi:hypothetical protein